VRQGSNVGSKQGDLLARFYSYHLQGGVKPEESNTRAEQLMKINKDRESHKVHAIVILGGDMNADMEDRQPGNSFTEAIDKLFTTEDDKKNRETHAVNFTQESKFKQKLTLTEEAHKNGIRTSDLNKIVNNMQTFISESSELNAKGKADIKKALSKELARLALKNNEVNVKQAMTSGYNCTHRQDQPRKIFLRPSTSGKIRLAATAQPEKIGGLTVRPIDSVGVINVGDRLKSRRLIEDNQLGVSKKINFELPLYPSWIMNLLKDEATADDYKLVNSMYKHCYAGVPAFKDADKGIVLMPNDSSPSDHLPVVTELTIRA
jgi:hypothetical protein